MHGRTHSLSMQASPAVTRPWPPASVYGFLKLSNPPLGSTPESWPSPPASPVCVIALLPPRLAFHDCSLVDSHRLTPLTATTPSVAPPVCTTFKATASPLLHEHRGRARPRQGHIPRPAWWREVRERTIGHWVADEHGNLTSRLQEISTAPWSERVTQPGQGQYDCCCAPLDVPLIFCSHYLHASHDSCMSNACGSTPPHPSACPILCKERTVRDTSYSPSRLGTPRVTHARIIDVGTTLRVPAS